MWTRTSYDNGQSIFQSFLLLLVGMLYYYYEEEEEEEEAKRHDIFWGVNLVQLFFPIIYHIAKFALCTSILENIQWKTDSQLLNWLATSISLGAFKKGGGYHMEQPKKWLFNL